MSKIKDFTSDLINRKRGFDQEQLDLETSEDKRLVRLGLDPNGDPVERTEKLRQMVEEIESKNGPGEDA